MLRALRLGWFWDGADVITHGIAKLRLGLEGYRRGTYALADLPAKPKLLLHCQDIPALASRLPPRPEIGELGHPANTWLGVSSVILCLACCRLVTLPSQRERWLKKNSGDTGSLLSHGRYSRFQKVGTWKWDELSYPFLDFERVLGGRSSFNLLSFWLPLYLRSFAASVQHPQHARAAKSLLRSSTCYNSVVLSNTARL